MIAACKNCGVTSCQHSALKEHTGQGSTRSGVHIAIHTRAHLCNHLYSNLSCHKISQSETGSQHIAGVCMLATAILVKNGRGIVGQQPAPNPSYCSERQHASLPVKQHRHCHYQSAMQGRVMACAFLDKGQMDVSFSQKATKSKEELMLPQDAQTSAPLSKTTRMNHKACE